MITLIAPRPAVKPTRPAALDGPARPDEDRDERGPDELAEAGPDWDALADESAALDRLCAGCLL
jgi:hypothetical protein